MNNKWKDMLPSKVYENIMKQLFGKYPLKKFVNGFNKQ